MKEKLTNLLEPSAVAPRTACRHAQGGARPGCSCSSCPRLGKFSLPEVEAQLQDGDILFTAAPNFIFRKVASTCQSWTSHVGIAFRGASSWEVAESTVPLSRFTSLRWFIRKSESRRFTLCRLKTGLSMNLKVGRVTPCAPSTAYVPAAGRGLPALPVQSGSEAQFVSLDGSRNLSPAQVSALRRAAEARMGIAYHFGFDYHSRLQFCSKFVHDVYEEALGVRLGRHETFTDLLTGNPDAPIAFWQYWFFGRIPWDRVTVTPATQLQSELLDTINSGVVTSLQN